MNDASLLMEINRHDPRILKAYMIADSFSFVPDYTTETMLDRSDVRRTFLFRECKQPSPFLLHIPTCF
jgi:hypothetical protein